MDKRLITVVAASAALNLPALPEMDPDRKPVAKALDTPEALHIDSDRLTDPLPTVIEREVRPFEPVMHNDSWLAYWDDDGDGVDADTTPLGMPVTLRESADLPAGAA